VAAQRSDGSERLGHGRLNVGKSCR
jgi:hypothetical protein